MYLSKSDAQFKNVLKGILPYAVLFLVASLVIIVPHIVFGFPKGHNFWHNLFWYQGFKEQLLAGELYPRWLFNYGQGFGAPVFYFYAPLPFYLFTLIELILGSYASDLTVLSIGHCSIVLFSGFTFHHLLRQRTTLFWSLTISSLYMFLPYHYLDIEHRSAIGESLAYIWIPFIVNKLLKSRSDRKQLLWSGVGYGCLIMSHLPSALLAIPIIAIFAIFSRSSIRLVRATLDALLVGVIGLLLSAIYFIPAIYLQKYQPFDAWVGSYGSAFHPVSWLIGQEAALHPFAPIVYLALTASTGMALLVASLSYVSKNQYINDNDSRSTKNLVRACFITLAVCWFLMTNLSRSIWLHVPFLPQVQFPWRIGVSVDFCSAFIVAMLAPGLVSSWQTYLSRFLPHSKLFLQIFVVVICLTVIGAIHSVYFPATIHSTSTRISTLNLIEYRPKWMVESQHYLSEELSGDLSNPELASSIHTRGFNSWSRYVDTLAEIEILRELNSLESISLIDERISEMSISVNLDSAATLRIKKLYYPHWEVISDLDNLPFKTYPDPKSGLILCDVPSGKYGLILQQKSLISEQIGLLISAITAIVILLTFFLSSKRREAF